MQEPKTPNAPLTYAEFEAYAEARDGRFEYVDGRAVAMGTPGNAHADLITALTVRFHERVRGQRCKVRIGARLWTGRNERSPDVLVTCDERDLSGEDVRTRFPKLIVEVLSPNRGDDLDGKPDDYREIHSVVEYAIADSRRRWVRMYRRNADGLFVLDPDRIGGDSLWLASIDYTLDLDELYTEVGIV